ncbi:hypothetical protein AYI69_g3105 [Smittium culicis]|uniref:Uncharacterized protein n=1 Tax=Smittium culicis TaxID=133412 RepID=A0A1R1YKK4_9FUNG|nr:hypothetical protein AYI69_g3105 [Smittium culicis]
MIYTYTRYTPETSFFSQPTYEVSTYRAQTPTVRVDSYHCAHSHHHNHQHIENTSETDHSADAMAAVRHKSSTLHYARNCPYKGTFAWDKSKLTCTSCVRNTDCANSCSCSKCSSYNAENLHEGYYNDELERLRDREISGCTDHDDRNNDDSSNEYTIHVNVRITI